MSNTIIINASAAKLGGAKTIVDGFIGWIAEHDNDTRFVLLSPACPEPLPNNILYIEKHTSGLSTWLFSCFWVAWYCTRYGAATCISFNNVNVLLPFWKRITYFHQAKVFTERSLRFKLIGWAIKCLRGTGFVVQSPLIAEQFHQHFGPAYKIDVRWPGVQLIETGTAHSNDDAVMRKTLLWPVTDPRVRQKNLSWFADNQQWFVDNHIEVLVTSKVEVDLPILKPVGLLSREALYQLYRDSDGIIIVSTEETLCLPIFEAASVGTRAFVLDMPYIRAIQKWRGLPANVTIIQGTEDIALSEQKVFSIDPSYFKPDWQIY